MHTNGSRGSSDGFGMRRILLAREFSSELRLAIDSPDSETPVTCLSFMIAQRFQLE